MEEAVPVLSDAKKIETLRIQRALLMHKSAIKELEEHLKNMLEAEAASMKIDTSKWRFDLDTLDFLAQA